MIPAAVGGIGRDREQWRALLLHHLGLSLHLKWTSSDLPNCLSMRR